MGNYDTGRKTDFECFIQDAELLNPIPTKALTRLGVSFHLDVLG